MEETFADVNPSYPVSNSSQNTSMPSGANDTRTVNKPQPKFNPEDLFYDMSGDKYLVIFNHTEYKNTRYYKYKTPSPRKGTEKDVEALKKTFSNLGYKVLTYHDLDHDGILSKASEISRMDHTMTSCLCFAILTHGDKGGKLYASDRPYDFSDITKMLANGDISLVNKPKLFFVQACRGGGMDDGRTVQLDGDDSDTFHVPSHADFLTMYSNVEGYASFRNASGSFVVQELCQAIDKYHDSQDVLHIATLVNKKVAYWRTSYNPSKKNEHNKKQMPEVRYTLTKLFKF